MEKYGPEHHDAKWPRKRILLQTLRPTYGKTIFLSLDHLRQGIGLRAYGQRDPLNEYKSEAFALFNAMLDDLRERVTTMLSRVELSAEPPPMPQALPAGMVENFAAPAFAGGDSFSEPDTLRINVGEAGAAVDPNDPTSWGGTSRNAPCPCGSGKKYKHCHGRAG